MTKAKTRLRTEKTRNKLENRIRTSTKDQRSEQIILCRLQQMVEEFRDENRNSNDPGNKRRSSSSRNAVFFRTNVYNEDTARDDYTCYRCKHFLEIPRNLSQPFSNGASSFQCKNELNLVQAIVWLKASIATASQIPLEQLQQLFNRLSIAHDEYHRENEPTDVEQLRSMDENLPTHERIALEDTRDTVEASNSPNISVVISDTSQNKLSSSYAESEVAQNKFVSSVPTNDPNKSPIVLSSIIERVDTESNFSENLEYTIMSCSIPEHQSFDYKNNMEYSPRNASVNQINEKIIGNKHNFEKSHADISNKLESTSPARNQSDLFDLKRNYNGESRILMRSQRNFVNEVLESNSSPNNFIITPKSSSQVSNNLANDPLLLDDCSPWQWNCTAAENSIEDSAYSTLHVIDQFNCNTTVEAGPTAANEHIPDIEQSCKKKTMYKTQEDLRLTNETLASDDSPKSFIITQEDLSQSSRVYNDENSNFEIISICDEQMSDIISETSENDAPVTAKFINSENSTAVPYKKSETVTSLQSCKEKTVTSENVTTASSSTIQKALTRNTEKRKSDRYQLEMENENKDEMISADWLNFTLESLRIDRVIRTSIKVIVSTLCGRGTAEEYLTRERQKKKRNCWKDSLEEQAVNAVLNMSDILTTEKKPNECIEIIMKEIITTLNGMMTQKQSYKVHITQTSVWIHCVHMILEFCNSLPICVKVIDYLITKLESLRSILINPGKGQRKTFVVINQMHLVFYALNISLQKYRTIMPCDQRSRFVEKMIPHVADLWKMRYIDNELEHAGIDLDAAEERWLNALENSVVVFPEHYVQFAEKSLSLVHVLISQSSTRVT